MELLSIGLSIDQQQLVDAKNDHVNFLLCKEIGIPGPSSKISVGFLWLKSSLQTNPPDESDCMAKWLTPPQKRPQITQSFPTPVKKKQIEKSDPSKVSSRNTSNLQKASTPVPNVLASEGFGECILDGEKLFMCASCSYKSKERYNMIRHVQCKHSDNPPCFRCRTCGNAFKEKNKLKNHYMKVHNLDSIAAKAASDSS